MGPHLVRNRKALDEAASVRGRDLRALRSSEAGGEKERECDVKLAFTLTMPSNNSWNGKWTGEGLL